MSQHGCPERLPNRSKGFQEDGSSQPTMEVLVETLTGTAFEMTVSPSDTIFAIKSKIFRVEGIPVSQQHLLYNLRELEDARSLREHSIGDGAKLRLVLGLRGGPVSTRRVPPADPLRDIERLLYPSRSDDEEGERCKATLLVFREGERVNLVRVKENRDGTYSPLDQHKRNTPRPRRRSAEGEAEAGALRDNAVTAGKMLDLRRRMESLSVRRADRRPVDKHDIQKTRSEETLAVLNMLDEAQDFAPRAFAPYADADEFAPLYDGNYTRYDYDCSFADRYALLPPIGARADSEQSIQESVVESVSEERLSLSDALAGSILVKRDDAPILEEPAHAPALPAADCGVARRWRARAFGSSVALAAPPAHARFCASTSDLEQLKRNRMLPALSRHRNREHLHLSDEGLDLRAPAPAPAAPEPARKRARCLLCRRRLSVATEHRCRCGGRYCAPHRYAEVHGCAHDYRAGADDALRRDNPHVQAPKLPKI